RSSTCCCGCARNGSASALERGQNLVRANYLSGIFGGISFAQYDAIKKLDGIEVAAPIGMIGYITGRGYESFDIGAELRGERTMFRLQFTHVLDRGLTRISYGAPDYAYFTRRPLEVGTGQGVQTQYVSEKLAGGRTVSLGKPFYQPPDPDPSPYYFDRKNRLIGWWSEKYAFDGEQPTPPQLSIAQDFPFVLAAVDPDAEARLAGLDDAMTGGRYLKQRESSESQTASMPGLKEIKLIASDRSYTDQREEAVISRLPAAAAERATTEPSARSFRAYLDGQRGQEVLRRTFDSRESYRLLLDQWENLSPDMWLPFTRYWVPGPTGYRVDGPRRVAALPVTNDPGVWKDPAYDMFGGLGAATMAPLGSADTQFRTLTPRYIEGGIDTLASRVVGRFDPAKLPGLNELTRVPMETYNPPEAAPGDARSRELLGNRPLLPGDNVAGYLQAPPLLLTNFDGLRLITEATKGAPAAQAPLSVVRVRVAGVTGPDAVSRERISQVARDIVAATGLDVDITIGSSPTPVTVDLPAGRYGRPALTLSEGWVSKGVAYQILEAADRKSVALFVLILAVCALFVLNAAAAAVRARRTELGVLACLGWARRRIFGVVLLELGLIGLLAGGLAALLALPLSAWSGLPEPGARTFLAIPAALALALLAGVPPALRAARVPPVEAVRPAARLPRRARSPCGVAGLAVTGLTRAPGRSLLGAATLAIAVVALTVLLGVTYGFRGRVVGSLLGDAIVLQARAVDYVAIGLMFALAALAVADVLYLGVRERDGELAALKAFGWPSAALARLIVTEGVGVGVLGAVAGAGVGLAVTLAVTGTAGAAVAVGALVAGAVAVLLAGLASVAPAVLVQRLPPARVLARE
ncbi:FtsX-like permease family protein, partial [Acrocarpospora macrocephala]|uniref:FtsX-like permease family protein n=3 Tax=Acrocarpospora macrocephala TaxID=150177 RepID=UPI0031D4DF98